MRVERRADVTYAFSKVEDTPQGGIRAPGYLTRIGVFEYTQPDGSILRELRHPKEVFSEDSLDTLRSAPVTLGHPDAPVTLENWRALVIGTVGDDVRADGEFVSSDVILQDAGAVAAVRAGVLKEFSCGYSCELDPTPGVWDGQAYDGVQRNIRYNHLALGGVDWGRAGPDVSLQLDQKDETYPLDMSESDLSKQLETVRGERDAANARVDTLSKELAETKEALEAAKAEATTEKLDSLVNARITLHDSARKVLGSDVTLAGKTDAQVMSEAIAASDAAFKTDGKHSEDYLKGRFEAVVKQCEAAGKALAKLNEDSAAAATSSETESVDPVSAARLRDRERSMNAWKKDK